MEPTPEDVPSSMADMSDEDAEKALAAEQAVVARSYTDKRAARFYDRNRNRIQKFVDRKGSVIGKAADFLLLVPDVFILLWRLLRDNRVSGKNKVLLGSAVAYYVFPFDLIPEAIVGPIGYLDDLIFGVYVLNRMMIDTDAAILREHWSGSEDVLQMIQRVMAAADELVSKQVIDRIKKLVKAVS
jgi:uncharacterized membrane protein YkvA (DUF1232 family)